MTLLDGHKKRAVGQKSRAPILGRMTPVEYEVAAEAVDKELLVA
jgi:hypothetical protein